MPQTRLSLRKFGTTRPANSLGSFARSLSLSDGFARWRPLEVLLYDWAAHQ